jgi:hypothetical protein
MMRCRSAALLHTFNRSTTWDLKVRVESAVLTAPYRQTLSTSLDISPIQNAISRGKFSGESSSSNMSRSFLASCICILSPWNFWCFYRIFMTGLHTAISINTITKLYRSCSLVKFVRGSHSASGCRYTFAKVFLESYNKSCRSDLSLYPHWLFRVLIRSFLPRKVKAAEYRRLNQSWSAFLGREEQCVFASNALVKPTVLINGVQRFCKKFG